jgi:hypothetical protein
METLRYGYAQYKSANDCCGDRRGYLCYDRWRSDFKLFCFASMDRSKIVALVTGIISIVLAIAYLVVVQIIDFRGEMLPAPIVETITIGLNI